MDWLAKVIVELVLANARLRREAEERIEREKEASRRMLREEFEAAERRGR